MSHITSISMDDETAQLEARMKREGKNFSKFVRECLLLYYREDMTEHSDLKRTVWEGCEPFCEPTPQAICRKCWPLGAPPTRTFDQARKHVRYLEKRRLEQTPYSDLEVPAEMCIPELLNLNEFGVIESIDLEPSVLAWLLGKAEESNRFIKPLADLDLVGNAKPAKAEKKRKGLLKRIFSEIGR